MYTRYLCVLMAALLLAPGAFAQQRLVPTDEAMAHVQRHAFQFGHGLTADDLSDLVVTDAYHSRRSGTSHVYLRQAHQGIPVVGTEIAVALDDAGRVFHAAGSATALTHHRLATSPALTAEAAAAAVAREAGLIGATFQAVSSTGGPAPEVRLNDGGVAEEPAKARLVYFRDANDAVTLAWEVGLYERGAQHYWHAYVDAASGRVLDRQDLVVHDHFGPADAHGAGGAEDLAPVAESAPILPSALVGSYRVYGMPVESPTHTAPLPPADGRTLVANPDDPFASPYGWHDTNGAPGAEHTRTRGNNVHAYTDVDGNNSPDANSDPDGGAGLLFDFPNNLAGAPSTYRDAAVTNLFYWNNLIHDVLWRHGWDEAAGNFQVNNYGNGGVGNDDVRAEAQDGGGINNANFFTPVDGERPRMQMFLWNFTNPLRDGDYDNGIIAHEYGHGYSRRLIGGPGTVSCMGNSEQVGEGISDYVGLILTMKPGDTRSTSRGVGTYSLGQPTNGCGIRCPPFQPSGAPYAADFGVNAFTYQDSRTQLIPHGVGFVWATIWWEVTWDMIDAYGFDPDIYNENGSAGNQVMLRLLTESLKLTPCNSGFIDHRNAMFAADQALYNGAHTGTMWHAFARRGLGANASQGSSSTNGDNTNGFALPDVTLRLTPDSPPVVAARGETISFDVELAMGAAGPGSVQYWVEATLPNGDVRVVLGPNTVNVTPGTTVSRALSQRVPGAAPLGDYLYTMKVGTYPGTVLSSDGFALTVEAASGRLAAGEDASEEDATWHTYDAEGRLIPDGSETAFALVEAATAPAAAASTLPDAPALHAAFPNPVATEATLHYDVPAAGPVRLVVYDLLGREVAVLADGAHTAGRHTATLDARGLPNGTYLVRMAAGASVQTQRVTVAR